jgi:exodeoxyribonuclease VII large subunit
MKTQTIFSVSEITHSIKAILEEGFADITIRGEISNCKRATSGHLYLTLKDEQCQIQGVMWKSRLGALGFAPQDGMNVLARGRITVYEVRGVYQIDILHLQPLGEGELQLAFERLKRQLADEGLFDSEHKKPIPAFPHRIGIVTSHTGAAIRDIENIISRRCPIVELYLYPVRVQGFGAAEEIAEGIRVFNKKFPVDVLIVGRGGGSLEDLWSFNEEVVARAIYSSKIPVVSAVGHEIDYTIADFVADLRAPTPSAAAEMVVPDSAEFVGKIRNFYYTGKQFLLERLGLEKQNIRSLLGSYAFNKPLDLLRRNSQHLDDLRRSLYRNISHRSTLLAERYGSLQHRLASLNPDAVLNRGYAVISHNKEVVGRAAMLHAQDDIDVKFHDGIVPATVKE